MIYSIINFILLQVQLEGFKDAADQSIISGVLVSSILVLFGVIVILYRDGKAKTKQINELRDTHSNKLEEIRKDYINKFDKINSEIAKKEEERNKQWRESEKETLNVLNGVTKILEMRDKVSQNDTKQILDKIHELEINLITLFDKSK